jgi:DNA-binding transcriptional MerR regulator
MFHIDSVVDYGVYTLIVRLKIGEVSRRAELGIETLRYYERLGLLGSPRRTESGYRLYSESIFGRLDFIRKAQAMGFTLEEIARIIQESETGRSPCAEVRRIARRKLEELDLRLKQLRQYRNELARTLTEWERKGSAAGKICGLIEESHIDHVPDRAMRARQ